MVIGAWYVFAKRELELMLLVLSSSSVGRSSRIAQDCTGLHRIA